MVNKVYKCHNTKDFRALAKKRLPYPIFHYIDGGSDDESTLLRNTQAFEKCDLVPNVLRGVEAIDTTVSVMGSTINLPFFFSPTALQRLFHHQGERAVAQVAEKFGTFFGISSLGTVSIEEIAKNYGGPKMFQLYVHKDQGLNNSMIEKCIENDFDAIAVTVDTIVGGNRERDYRTGFTSPPKLTLKSMSSFALHPGWTLNYLFREKFELPQLQDHIKQGTAQYPQVADMRLLTEPFSQSHLRSSPHEDPAFLESWSSGFAKCIRNWVLRGGEISWCSAPRNGPICNPSRRRKAPLSCRKCTNMGTSSGTSTGRS